MERPTRRIVTRMRMKLRPLPVIDAAGTAQRLEEARKISERGRMKLASIIVSIARSKNIKVDEY